MNWLDFFQDHYGVTQNKDPKENIVLHFYGDTGHYVETKPLHPIQKHTNEDNGLEIRLKLIPNYELESLILSYGENVLVIEPISLREQIKNRTALSLERYKC